MVMVLSLPLSQTYMPDINCSWPSSGVRGPNKPQSQKEDENARHFNLWNPVDLEMKNWVNKLILYLSHKTKICTHISFLILVVLGKVDAIFSFSFTGNNPGTHGSEVTDLEMSILLCPSQSWPGHPAPAGFLGFVFGFSGFLEDSASKKSLVC